MITLFFCFKRMWLNLARSQIAVLFFLLMSSELFLYISVMHFPTIIYSVYYFQSSQCDIFYLHISIKLAKMKTIEWSTRMILSLIKFPPQASVLERLRWLFPNSLPETLCCSWSPSRRRLAAGCSIQLWLLHWERPARRWRTQSLQQWVTPHWIITQINNLY